MSRHTIASGHPIQEPGAPRLQGPTSKSAKHLADCNVLILSQTDSIGKSWGDTAKVALQGNCKKVDVHPCPDPRFLGQAFDQAIAAAKEVDIVLFTFYMNSSEVVNRLIATLRREKPDIKIAILSATPELVRTREANAVLFKQEISMDPSYLLRELSNMLARSELP